MTGRAKERRCKVYILATGRENGIENTRGESR